MYSIISSVKKNINTRKEKRVQERKFKSEAAKVANQTYAIERKKYLESQAVKKAKARATAPTIGQSIMGGIQSYSKSSPNKKAAKPKEIPNIFGGSNNKGNGGIPKFF